MNKAFAQWYGKYFLSAMINHEYYNPVLYNRNSNHPNFSSCICATTINETTVTGMVLFSALALKKQ
jgi:hypothetical protein